MLGRVIDRLNHAVGAQGWELIVATSEEDDDDPIVKFAEAENIDVHRGSLENVAARALGAAANLDYFVRISADSPFIDPVVITTAVDVARSEQWDLVTNIFPRTFPRGMSVEVVKTDAFREMLDGPMTEDECEHVTKAFYNRPEDFQITNFEAPQGDLSAINLTVDTPEDLRKAQWIDRKLGPQSSTAPLAEIIEAAREFDIIPGNELV